MNFLPKKKKEKILLARYPIYISQSSAKVGCDMLISDFEAFIKKVFGHFPVL